MCVLYPFEDIPSTPKSAFNSLSSFFLPRKLSSNPQLLIALPCAKLYEPPLILMCSGELLQAPNPKSTTLKAFPIHSYSFLLLFLPLKTKELKLEIENSLTLDSSQSLSFPPHKNGKQ
jgi:hypothetical protein